MVLQKNEMKIKLRLWPSSMGIPNPGFKPDIQYCAGVIFKEIILRLIKHNIQVLKRSTQDSQ
jgi:hypothetical protein